MSKFFVEPGNINKDSVLITGENIKHIKNVLRLSAGDEIMVSDGQGTDYRVRISRFDSNGISAVIVEKFRNNTEPPIWVTLYQGIPKSDKMDFIIQKCIELGIARIVPVMTERTIVRFSSHDDIEKKVSRWKKISEEASKQCNRGIIPDVAMPIFFEEAVRESSGYQLSIMPYENERKNRLASIIKKCNFKKISVFIGPEGGFSDKEAAIALEKGIIPVTLGPRILRTETAGMAVLSIIMYELGDL